MAVRRRRALLRYLALSSAIVLAVFVVVGTWFNREKIALEIKSVYASVPPKVSQTAPPSKRHTTTVFGDAPWAMSALPECFQQQSKTTGPYGYVMAHLPPGMTMLRSGETATFGDCALQVKGDTVLVTRGSDRLRIPPVARLYRNGSTVALVRSGNGGLELRVYAASPASTTP